MPAIAGHVGPNTNSEGGTIPSGKEGGGRTSFKEAHVIYACMAHCKGT